MPAAIELIHKARAHVSLLLYLLIRNEPGDGFKCYLTRQESNVQNTPVGNTLAVVQSGIFFFLQTG